MDPKLFVNDGSFLERFKQIQKEKEEKIEVPQNSGSGSASLVTSTPKTVVSKTTIQMKGNGSHKQNQAPSGGKLAFSLKQKSKLATPAVKFGEDEDDCDKEKDGGNSSGGSVKRQKLVQSNTSDHSSKPVGVAPPPPSDPTVRKVADKLASFVAKNGRQFEHVSRQKNPGDTPFKFLFYESCPDYKYYEYRLAEEEKALSQARDIEKPQSGTTTPVPTANSQESRHHHSKFQTPATALYEPPENAGYSDTYSQTPSGGSGESSGTGGSDPIAMMEYYMKKAAQEEKRRPLRYSNDEMPPPASFQDTGKKGHHMGDYIPPDELEKFLATCNDAAARKNAIEQAEKAKIQADNVGHRLLSKMGWREGEGLGSSRSGIATPIMAGDVKKDNLGVGAQAPGEVTPEDDIYEQYKKRMMLGYKYRPNPLNNPRKQYY